MGMSYDRSIFAVELDNFLQQHGYAIHRLRGKPFQLEGKKVARLETNLTSLKSIASLNHFDLGIILDCIKSTSREQRIRLYAALIALGCQWQLIDSGLTNKRAWEIAEEVCTAAYTWIFTHPSQDDLLRRLRLRRISGENEETQNPPLPTGGTLLAEALDEYGEGMALHTIGIELTDRVRLEVAALCYQRALRLLQALAPSIRDTEDWQFWHQEVKAQHDIILEQLA